MSAWLAIYTSPNQEALAARNLRRLAIDVFYPFERVKTLRKRGLTMRPMLIERPYFSRYLFAQVPDNLLAQVHDTTGVSGIVNRRGEPLHIPDGVVEEIQQKADDTGCLGAVDLSTRRSRFRARVGDQFYFKADGNILHGLLGRLSSLAKLESHGEVAAFVRFLGSEREVRVPAGLVGEVIPATLTYARELKLGAVGT